MDARGSGNRDAEGAAERRLAEALRAQASLGGRSPATPQAAPPAPGRPGQGPAQAMGTPPKGQPPQSAKGPKTAPKSGQSGSPQPRRGPGGPPPTATPHTRQAPGGAQRARDRAEGAVTAQVGVVDALAAAPTAQQAAHPTAPAKAGAAKSGPPKTGPPIAVTPGAAPSGPAGPGPSGAGPRPTGAKPAGPPRAGAPRGPHTGPRVAAPLPGSAGSSPARPAAVAERPPLDGRLAGIAVQLRWVLLAGLLAGALLGCLLAVLSVLDTGLLPALG